MLTCSIVPVTSHSLPAKLQTLCQATDSLPSYSLSAKLQTLCQATDSLPSYSLSAKLQSLCQAIVSLPSYSLSAKHVLLHPRYLQNQLPLGEITLAKALKGPEAWASAFLRSVIKRSPCGERVVILVNLLVIGLGQCNLVQ